MAVAGLRLSAHASDDMAGTMLFQTVAGEFDAYARGDHGTAQDLFRNLRQLFQRLRDEAGPGGPRVDSTGPDGARTLTYTVSRQQHPDGGVFAAAVTVVIKGVLCHEEPFDFDEATAESVSFVVVSPFAAGFTVNIESANRRDSCFSLSLLSTDGEAPQVSVDRADPNAPRLADSGLALADPARHFLLELLASPRQRASTLAAQLNGGDDRQTRGRVEENTRLKAKVKCLEERISSLEQADLETRMAGLEQTVRSLSGQNDSCKQRIDAVARKQQAAKCNCQANIANFKRDVDQKLTKSADSATAALQASEKRANDAHAKALCDAIANCKLYVDKLLNTKLQKSAERATAALRASETRADDSRAKSLRDTYRKIWRATDGRLRELTTFNGACWALKHHSATIFPIVVGRRMYIIGRGVHGIVGRWTSLDDNAQGNVPTSAMPAVGEEWKMPEFFRAWQVTSVGNRYIVVSARQANALHFRVLDTKVNAWKDFGHVDPLTEVEWSKSEHHDTVQIAAVGASWLVAVARRESGLVLWVASTTTLEDPSRSPVWKACPILTELSDAAGCADPRYCRTIKLASGHDGKSLFCVACKPGAKMSVGLQAWRIDCGTRTRHTLSPLPAAFTSSNYETAQLAALSSNSFVFLMRGSDGISGYRLDVPLKGTATWTPITDLAAFKNLGGWHKAPYCGTLRLVCRPQCDDVVLVGRGANGAVAFTFDDTKRLPWRSMQMPSTNSCFSNDAGFVHESAYATCRVVVDGADVFMCGRGPKGYYLQRLTPV